MAFFDNKGMILSHIRHSFVVSDDTGMCELIIVKEDVEKEIQNDHSFHKKSIRMRQRYQGKNGGIRDLEKTGTSYDIRASPSMPRRPPMNNDSNMFEIMEARKKKKSGGKSIVIKWQDPSPDSTSDQPCFKREPIKKVQPKQSPLTKLLAEQQKKTANPFFMYQKFNGESQGSSAANKCSVFISMAKNPFKPVNVSVLHNARVEDLIGLVFWKFLDEERESISFKPVSYYSVMIAEDDGEIDVDLPELDRNEFIGKYGFKHLGIVMSSSPVRGDHDEDDDTKKHKIVKVYYEDGGFSTIAVDSLDIEMSELLTLVMRKRRLQFQGYELELKDHPGQFVELSSTLRSQGTMDFKLKHISRYSNPDDGVDRPARTKERSFTQVKVQLTSHQYKAFNVMMLHKVKSSARVQLGIDYEHIEIQPVDPQSGKGGFRKQNVKPVQYDINEIRSCAIITEERSSGGCMFRIVRTSKEGSKNIDFEAPLHVAKEIVQKISLILNDTSDVSQSDQEVTMKRKISRSNV